MSSFSGRAQNPLAADSGDRVAWVDTAKGICIILVVMMHATLGVGEAMGGTGFMHEVVAFAKPFRMPDFFLVSGLFLARVIDRDWRSYGDKRVLHFAYFYVLWLLIQSAFKYGALSGGSPAAFVGHLALSLVEPFGTLWFVYLLAVFSVVTKLLRNVPASFLLAGGALLQIAPIATGSILIDEFSERYVYFLAGYLLAPQIFALARWAQDRVLLALAGIGGWALLNGALALTPSPIAGFATFAEWPGVALLLGLFGAMAIVALASLLTLTPVARPFRYAGEHSIAIYLAFFLPMAVTRIVLAKTGIISDIGLVSLIVTIVAVLAPLVLERLVRHTPLRVLFVRPAMLRLAPAPQARLQPAE